MRFAAGDLEQLRDRLIAPNGWDAIPEDKRLARIKGQDWPADGAATMIGHERLKNISDLAERIARDQVPGDFMECGVWRGGAALYMRACLDAFGLDDRKVFVADSFEGCPTPEPELYPADASDPHSTFPFLKVPMGDVIANFAKFGLDDERVHFLPGWFKDTLPGPVEKLSLLRLDGDMYASTIQALEALYPKLAIGGYLILDDYQNIPQCRQAIEDFRKKYRIAEPLAPVDWCAVYWKKEREQQLTAAPVFSICHSSARPYQWRQIYDSWIAEAAEPERVEYVLCADVRWDFKAGPVLTAWEKERPGLNRLAWNTGRRCYVDGVNTAAAASTGQLLIVNADDQWPAARWDSKILKAVKKAHPGCEPFGFPRIVVEVSTGTTNEHQRGIIVMPILSRERYEQQSHEVFYREYESMYADNDFCEHARQDGVIIDARALMFPHRHPNFDKTVRDDEAYQQQNRAEAYQLGSALLARRRRVGFSDLAPRTPNDQGTPIVLLLPGENFSSQWVCNFTGLMAHLTDIGFRVAASFGHSSNVFITRSFLAKGALETVPKPQYVLWIDDDQILTPEAFDQLLQSIEAVPDADMVAAWTWIFDPEKPRISAGKLDRAKDEVTHIPNAEMVRCMSEGSLIEVEWTGFPAVLMKREALEKAGKLPFSPMLAPKSTWGHAGEDVSFCTRLRNAGGKIFVDSRCFVPHLKYIPFIPVSSIPGAEKKPLVDAMPALVG